MSSVQTPHNEPVLSYAPGTPERSEVQATLKHLEQERRELPNIIDGEAVHTQSHFEIRPPHKHQQVVAIAFDANHKHVEAAIAAAMHARQSWASTHFEERAAVFLRAADMVSGRYRALINAATMLGQSKTVHQAELDAACELADFLRFNVHFARQILEMQPLTTPGARNSSDYRALDGFVVAITPFNFTAIGGNLPTAPAIMGNTVVWKPATTSILSNHVFMDILIEAGLPKGVINLVHAPGKVVSEVALAHPDLAGVHFTGSTATFETIWQTVGSNLSKYKCYPRVVGETGGKDFIVAHPSADPETLVTGLIRGAYEFQGQKCSATSRAYIPESLWPQVSERLVAELKKIKVGDVADFSNFMGAVIDRASYNNIKNYLGFARDKIFWGGDQDDKTGYFVTPTVVLTEDPKYKLMCEEIFGPVLTIYRYTDKQFEQTLELCDTTSPYALTGAIFARDRQAIQQATQKLRFAAGNFYINDKPSGSVVAQQPFGGARKSGTNDKAGSLLNMLRWTSPRTIKETFDAPRTVAYPYMA
jgi:1-pyrroline-5-carboxylate dehydrogenase